MTRVLTEIALFLTPFVLYAAFLLASNADVLHAKSWARVGFPVVRAMKLRRGSRDFPESFRRAGLKEPYLHACIHFPVDSARPAAYIEPP